MKNFGVANSISVSAPEAFNDAIWAATSAPVYSYYSHGNDLRALAGDRPRQPAGHVLAELGVLVEHGDPRLRVALDDLPPVDRALAAVALEEAHRPRVALRRTADRLGTVACEQLRDLPRVQVVADREVVGGADRVEDGEHAVLLDELPGQLHRLRRVVAVVVEAVDDLPPVDAARGVDVVEVRLRTGADRAERGGLTGQRDGAADQHRRRGDTRLGARSCAGGRCRDRRQRQRGERDDETVHETGFASAGIDAVTRVTAAIRAPAGIGSWR